MNDKSALAMVRERRVIAYEGNRDAYDAAAENERLYLNYIDETSHPFISNISLPWPYIIIESYLGKCVQMLSILPYIRIVEEDDDSREKAKRIERDVNMTFYRQKWPIFSYNCYKEAFKYGSAFVFVSPWAQVGNTWMPKFIRWNFFHTFWNPYIDDFTDDDAYVIYESFVPLETLRNLKGNPYYKNLSSIREHSGEIQTDNEKLIDSYKNKPQRRWDRYSKLVKVEFYLSAKDIIVITNDNNVIRNTRNHLGYINVKNIRPIPVDNDFIGMSILEQGKGLFAEANENRNQYNDAVNLMLNPQWIIDRNAGVTRGTIITRSGNILFADDVNGVVPMEVDWNILAQSIARGAIIDRDIQNYSNAFPQFRGSSESGADTATEYIGMRQAGELRSQTYNLLLSMMSIESMAEDVVNLKRLHMSDDEKFYYWPENETAIVSPEDYKGNFTFRAYSGFKQAREIERKQLIEALTFIFGNQAFLPIVMPKANEWLERLIDYFDLRSPEQLYVTDQDQAKAQMDQFLQSMMMGMAGGGGNGKKPALGEREMRMPEMSSNPPTMQMLGR